MGSNRECVPETWCEEECQKKRKMWWIFVIAILASIFALWVVVICYLLVPFPSPILNRQVLLEDPQGGKHLVIVIRKSHSKSNSHKIISKQDFVTLYDLEKKKFIGGETSDTKLFSVLPTISQNHAYYFLAYKPIDKIYYRTVFDSKLGDMVPTQPYTTSTYFWKEMLFWMLRSKDSKHVHRIQQL